MRAISQHYGVNKVLNFSHIDCLKNEKRLDMCIVVRVLNATWCALLGAFVKDVSVH
jgi:hypothetical protein